MNRTPHDLLTLAADEIDVPVPDAAAVIERGRRQHRGSSLRRAALPAAAVAASVAAAALLLPQPDRTPQIDVTQVAGPAFDADTTAEISRTLADTGAFAIGTTLYLGSADPTPIELEVPAVRGLYITSAGVLVRHGKDEAMDVASKYSLVGPDGSVLAVDLDPGDVAVGTDPTQPYLAYAVGSGNSWTVQVVDLRTGEIAGSQAVEGRFSWGGWDAPPVSLSGDLVWVGLDDEMVALDWRTGEEVPSALPGSLFPQVEEGRQVLEERDDNDETTAFRVVDARTGAVLLERNVTTQEPTLGILSPDGGTLMVGPYLNSGEDGVVRDTADTRIIDVATGQELDLPTSAVGGFGWTPRGQVFSLDGQNATVCDAQEQQCATHGLDLGLEGSAIDSLKLAGLVTDS